jgi:hypothetical protein
MGIAALTALAVVSMAAGNSPWSNCKPGAWSKLKTTSKTAVAGQTHNTTIETKMTLVSKSDDKATVETETTMMGSTTRTTGDIPLKSDAKGASRTPVKTGSETVTVAGKTFQCKTVEVQSEANGMKTSTKSWVADEVPGGIVKTVSTSTGSMSSKVTTELVDFKR